MLVRRSVLITLAILAILEIGFIAYRMQVALAVGNAGQLRVTSDPAGGTVIIDGVVRGATPLTLSISKGEHRVQIRTANATQRSTVAIAAGATSSQHFEFRAPDEPASSTAIASGNLEIATEPSGISVRLDGVSRGVTPARLTSVQPGLHNVVLTNGGQSVNREITVEPGSATTLFVPFVTAPATAFGWLQISSPIVMQLYEHGSLLGTTEIDRIMVPVGAHEIDIVNRALDYSTTATLQLEPGKASTFAVKLPNGSVYLNALPWADVWIDGQRIGETPLANVPVPIGAHDVLFRHPQLGEQRRTVVVRRSGTTRVGVEFGK